MYLGVDLGTTSIKVLLASGTKIIDSARAEYPIYYPQANWSEQNPEDWFEGLVSCLRELAIRNDLSQVNAISFSGQMHGLVALDGGNEVIRPALLWNDGRTTAECDYLNNIVGKENLIKWTGNIALTGFTAPKILWLKNNEPEHYAKIRKIMLPKDYLAYRLTGVFATDVSDASGTLLFDVANRRWNKHMLDVVGISEKQLPKVFESVETIGEILPQVASKLNLPEHVKVVIGGGDQAMGAIGAGAVEPNSVSINLGTSGVVFINSGDYVKDNSEGMHLFCNAIGGYHLMGVTLSCAASNAWWTENILQSNYSDTLDGISKMPIDNDLIFLPYLIGERSPINDPSAKGILYGLRINQNQKDLTKAVIEGICFSLLDCLNVARKGGVNPTCANVIGGGSKSADWLQILSDVTGLNLYTLTTNEGGGLGAIILCAVANGDFSSITEATKAFVLQEKSYAPNKVNSQVYTEKYTAYKKLYKATK